MTAYSSNEVCNISSITYRQLDYWIRTGIVRPSINDGFGSGHRRQFSHDDLIILKVLKHLLDAGISLERIRQSVGMIRNGLALDLKKQSSLIVSQRAILIVDPENLAEVVFDHQPCWVMPIDLSVEPTDQEEEDFAE